MAHTWGAWFASVLNRMFSWLPFPSEWKFEGRVRVVANVALKGDWETVSLVFNESWKCPEGQYEVFVAVNLDDALDAGNLVLNDNFCILNFTTLGAGIWFPCYYLPLVVTRWLSDGVAAPNTGFDYDWFVEYPFMMQSDGFSLNKGDVLSVVGSTMGKWDVRFRRVA